MQPSRRFSEQCFWCWRSDSHSMEGSGSDSVASMPAAVRSHWNTSIVDLGFFAQKGSFAVFLGLLCSVNWGQKWGDLPSRPKKKFPKLVSLLWCEKPGKLGDFKSKRILGFWANYKKSHGLRNPLGHLVTLCWLGSSDTSSTTPAGSVEPHHPLDKAFSSISWHQNLGTFYKEVSCVPRHATLPVILSTVWSPLWDQSKAFPPKADLHHLIIEITP